ncbi:hypothetical protein ELI38_07825 [Rhizobium leguminosarum]|uniref:hypothetical protein n=1 Tax=Rhizobium leguminosarum TaxID=384 RepID=UPI000369D3F3|nr:hypothetical protein [Rhizobium leguminosarum]NKK31859.1 hypothetical protein [Rhizobium leguminosarum bv. viciae]TAU95883.1 hypothetical protein ELI38_07825 [Rhizobium leguminosarum]
MQNLPGVSAVIPNEKPPKASANGAALRLVTIDSLDGRTQAAKEARSLRSAIIRDLTGGDDETALSALKLALVDAVAIATVIINDANVRWLKGEPVSLTEITTLSNARRRDAQLLGLERVPRDITDLDSYLAAKVINQ